MLEIVRQYKCDVHKTELATRPGVRVFWPNDETGRTGVWYRFDTCEKCEDTLGDVLQPIFEQVGPSDKPTNLPVDVKWMYGIGSKGEHTAEHATVDGRRSLCGFIDNLFDVGDGSTKKCTHCLGKVETMRG